MARLLLDTSALISNWRFCSGGSLQRKTEQQARAWADRLAQLYETRDVVTPVVIEFLAGVRSNHELVLARAYLSGFHVVDEGRILQSDWARAQQIAERVPRDGKPRQMGDCLIRAVAERLRYAVISSDERFPP